MQHFMTLMSVKLEFTHLLIVDCMGPYCASLI